MYVQQDVRTARSRAGGGGRHRRRLAARAGRTLSATPDTRLATLRRPSPPPLPRRLDELVAPCRWGRGASARGAPTPGVSAGPRHALSLIKENLDLALEQDYLSALDHEAELMIQAQQTADHKEAVRAFVEKRKPVFGQG